MARGPDAFFYGFTGIINHRFSTNQMTRTISVFYKGLISQIRKLAAYKPNVGIREYVLTSKNVTFLE